MGILLGLSILGAGLLVMLFLYPNRPVSPAGPAPRRSLKQYFNQTFLPPDNYIVVDLETTGLDACTCEILEIGAIKYEQHCETGRYHTMVRPEGAIPRSASDVNHIAWNKVCNAPSMGEIESAFFDFLGDETLVGYNVGFDIKFIQTRFSKQLKNQAFDVLSLARDTIPNLDDYKQDTLRRHFALSGLAHTALGDCETTFQVYQKCRNSPEGQAYREKYLNLAMAQQAQQESELARHKSVLERKAQAKSNSPTMSELRKISANMTGTQRAYFSKVEELLLGHGHSLEPVVRDSVGGYLIHRSHGPFFGVKLSGSLRYIILDIPIESYQGSFVCTPSSMAEGEDTTRIYIANPDDLSAISDYIVAAYQRIQGCELPAIGTSEQAHFEPDELPQ